MRRWTIGLAALALMIAASASAHTSTYFGFQIGIGNAPPPPEVVFMSAPRLYCDPETRVYVVQGDYDEDVFRYGPYWYACDEGYWYRARSYGGPYAVIDVRYVPQPIFRVPARRWRHYPAGLARWNGGSSRYRAADHRYRQGGNDYAWREGGNEERHERDNDRGKGRGHGDGRGKGHHDKHGDD